MEKFTEFKNIVTDPNTYCRKYKEETGKKIVQDITQYYNDLFSGLVEKLGTEQSDLLIELLNQVNIYFDEWYKKD